MEFKNSQNNVEETDTTVKVEGLYWGSEKVLEKSLPKKTSGLVEMQKYFMKHPFYKKLSRSEEIKASQI